MYHNCKAKSTLYLSLLPKTWCCGRPQDILAAAVPQTGPTLDWDAAAESKEDPVQTQTQHKKVRTRHYPTAPCNVIHKLRVPSSSKRQLLSRSWTKGYLMVAFLAYLEDKCSWETVKI